MSEKVNVKDLFTEIGEMLSKELGVNLKLKSIEQVSKEVK